MAVATPTRSRVSTTGALIDQMWAKREEKRKLEVSLKVVEDDMKELEEQLFERMDTEGLDKATGRAASASISSSTAADVQDWDVFWAYVIKSKNTQLLQRRVSDPAYRELMEMGKKIPGVQPFTKKRLNLRSL